MAYCLMPNHVHLIAVPHSADGLRREIGEIQRLYTPLVNFREGWRGHLWQGRFASFVLDEPYLLTPAQRFPGVYSRIFSMIGARIVGITWLGSASLRRSCTEAYFCFRSIISGVPPRVDSITAASRLTRSSSCWRPPLRLPLARSVVRSPTAFTAAITAPLLTCLASAKPFGSQSRSDGSFARSPNVHDESLPSACWDLLVHIAVQPIGSAKPMKRSGLPLAASLALVSPFAWPSLPVLTRFSGA